MSENYAIMCERVLRKLDSLGCKDQAIAAAVIRLKNQAVFSEQLINQLEQAKGEIRQLEFELEMLLGAVVLQPEAEGDRPF